MKQEIKKTSRTLFVFSGLVMALALTGCNSTPPPPTVTARSAPHNQGQTEALSLFSKGMTLDVAGDSKGALSNYLEAVELDSQNATLHMLAARRLLGQERQDDALRLMEALTERAPENAAALKWLAGIQVATDQRAEAIETFKQAITVNPQDASAYLQAARLLHGEKKSAEAIAILDQAILAAGVQPDTVRLKTALLLSLAKSTLDQDTVQTYRDEVIRTLQKGLQAHPEETPFAFQLASLLASEQRVEEMIETYREIKPQDSSEIDIRQLIAGQLVRALGDAETALLKLQAYSAEHPDDAWSVYMLGQVYEFGGNDQEALASYENARELDPTDLPSIWKTALFQSKAGDTGTATKLLNLALETHPDDPELTALTASLYLDINELDRAVNLFASVAKTLDAKDTTLKNEPHYRYGYASALYRAGKRKAALTQMHKAMSKNPSYLHVFWRTELSRAQNHAATEDEHLYIQQEALSFMTEIAPRFPDSPIPNYLIARHQMLEEDYTKAVSSLRKAASIAQRLPDPKSFLNAEFYFDFGTAYERSGDLEKAEQMFLRTLAMKPDFANAYNYLAYTWAENNIQLEKAMDYVTIALDLEPDNGAFLDTRGWIHFKNENYNEAYADLKRAAEILDDDPVITEHLGDVLMRLDRPVEALGYYRIAHELGAEKDLSGKIAEAQTALASSLVEKDEPSDSE